MSRAVAIMMALMVCGVTTAATINVPGNYSTIQAAVDAASNGDEIIVAPGTYIGSGNEVMNTLGKAITIRASGTAEETILDGEGARRVVLCNSGEGADTVIEGFTITGGNADYGGGIYCGTSSSPTISGCTITDNTANYGGGGIYCNGVWPQSIPTITDCTISNNTAYYYGGGIYCSGNSNPTITGCTISNNTAYYYGGGIYCNDSNPTITGCTISNNTANRGGGIFCYQSSLTIAGCTISNNTATTGGGIYCGTSGTPTIRDCTISGNTASIGTGGGGIWISTNGTTLTNTLMCGNAPNNIGGYWDWTDGGGVCLATYCTDSDADGIIDECDDQVGDGIHEVPGEFEQIDEAVAAANDGDTVLVATGTYTGTGAWVINPRGKSITIRAIGTAEETILDGQGARRVVLCDSGEGAGTVIEGFTITGGSAGNGGGIYCSSSSPTITGCTISGNTATTSGGGIYCNGSSPTITGCTISNNTAISNAQTYGGGIYCGTSSSPTITGCTITGNTASNPADWSSRGGGIYCGTSSSPTITGCTISGNTASSYGGGIYCHHASNPTLIGCTISGNTATTSGGGIYCNASSNATLTDTLLCGNAPDAIYGPWTDGGGMCAATYCIDSDADGIIDECDDQVGDGIHEVPGEFEQIDEAVAAANDGDTVLVATGTYTGTGAWVINPRGNSITIRATGTAEETILDGQGARRVVLCDSGEGAGTVIEGFTITGGSADNGGGIYCSSSNPTISGCTISSNTANADGGGIYFDDSSSPTITGCTISGNTATTSGGGIYCNDSNPTLTDTVVCENAPDNIFGSWTDGGGMCLAYSCQDSDGNGVPDKCDGSIGDGIHEVPSEYATVQEAINAAGYGDTVLVAPGTYTGTGDWVINPGGKPITIRATGTPEETILDGQGVRRIVQIAGGEGADTVIEGFTITGGSADNGGGIYCYDYSSPTITGCTISGNTATTSGGGIYCSYSSSPTITDCVIESNTAASEGGGIYCYYNSSSPMLTDTVVCDNTPDQILGDWSDLGNNCVSNNCDTDSDGTYDCNDNCPNDPNKIEPGVCGCGVADTDTDEDGVLDCNDNCPNDPNKIEPGICGCGVADTDSDGDGTADCKDGCPDDPNKVTPGQCGCGAPDTDSDGDGTADCIDGCPNDPNKVAPGQCGCGLADTDSDGDGTADCNDGCPDDPNKIEPGICGCGVADTDSDGDGTVDCKDNIYTWIVDDDGPAAFDNIQAAIDAASDNEEILVAPGVYTGTSGWVINPSGKAITIRAIGTPEETILDGEGVRRVVHCQGGEGPDTVIEGFTITGGSTEILASGGGIYCYESDPTITECTISGNTAYDYGGGIYCEQSSPTITGCTISGNTARHGGGIWCYDNSSPTLTSCTISGNTAEYYGGGIYYGQSSPTITGCTISDNTAKEGGGIRCAIGSSSAITDCTISGNTATRYGGGIDCFKSSPTITDCTISGNTAKYNGGGINCYESSPTITDCTISNNTTTGYVLGVDGGGGIRCDYYSNPTITGCRISNNTSATGYGGGIYSSHVDLTVTDTVVCENDPDNIYGSWIDGGGTCLAYSCQDSDGNGVPDECDGSIGDGIHEVPSEYATVQEAINAAGYGDTVLVAPGTYTGTGDWVINPLGKPITIRATGTPEETILDGEGVRHVVQIAGSEGADTVIEGFTITGGSAAGEYTSGGGIRCVSGSSPTITDCTISDNTAIIGGGIYCNYNSDPTITGCTISGNTATYGGGGIGIGYLGMATITDCVIESNTAGYGGGIWCSQSNPTITGCTISGNTADSNGGGIYCQDSSPMLTDTVVCDNTPDQILGDWSDLGNNCVSNNCDTDSDGTYDCNDNCPNDPNKIDPGICGCGIPDTDTDGDGTADCNDACPDDPNKIETGQCGCGVADTDSDGDGTADCNDGCPNDPNKIDSGICGCGVADTDTDGDSTVDCNDGCLNDPDKVDPGICGCGVADTDTDGDGIADCDDPCPFWSGSCDNDGSTLYVVTGESINDAIDGVPHEGVVQIMPGTHFIDSPIDLQGRAVTLRAGGASGSVIIDGQGVSAGIQCVSGETSHTLIYGLTIQNCGGTTGAGMLCDGSSPNIVMCIFTGNTANQGGGIACRNGAAPSLIDCEITGNDASGSDGGGVWVSSAEITMIACDVSANTADEDGGGIYLSYATANLHEINVAGNTADYGGGLFGYASTVTMTNAIVENNFAASDGSNATDGGGGISMDGGDWMIDGCLIQDNFSLANAGGLLSNQAAVTLDHSTVRGNTASTLAGGVYSQGSMYVANTAICSNTPSQIIGAHVDGGGNSISILCQANSAACCLPLENMCLLAEEPDCTYLGGQWLGAGTTCVGDPCDIAPPICPADIDHNQTIDASDLLLVLYAWGGQSDSADVNGDGLVSVMDLLEVLSQWGPCE